MNKYNILRDKIQEEYENNSISLKELSVKYSIPYDTVQTWSKKFNWKKPLKEPIVQNKELYHQAKDLFENTSLNYKQISSKLNIPWSTVQTWSKKFNWKKLDKYMEEYKKSLKPKIKISSSDDIVLQIKQLYETTDFSIPEIANKVNLSIDSTRNRIKKFNFIRPIDLQNSCNSRLGKLRQLNLTETQKKDRNKKIKLWNINHIGQIHNTRKLRNRYSKSNIEDSLYTYLINEFGENNVERQYIINNLSFDFKITRYDKNNEKFEQLIELHGAFYHNYRPYIECLEHNEEYNNLINKGGMYKTIAHKWKDIDTSKYLFCKAQNLNYLAIYFDENPKPYFTKKELINSYKLIKNQKFNYTNISRNNEIIDTFCYKLIYNNNLSKFKQPNIIYPYLINRIKYAYNNGKGVHNITLLKLLKDFNKAGNMLNSYTMHPINNIRTFINEYKCNFIADPFAGWGHRLIGAMSMNCNYIGVDINKEQYKNLLDIKQFIKTIDNITSEQIILNMDSYMFDNSKYNYDSIFTCPPYYNKEIYTDIGIENLDYNTYKNTIKNIFNKWIKSSVKVIGIQFTDEFEDVIDNLGYSYKKIILNQGNHHFTKISKKYHEYLYIIEL